MIKKLTFTPDNLLAKPGQFRLVWLTIRLRIYLIRYEKLSEKNAIANVRRLYSNPSPMQILTQTHSKMLLKPSMAKMELLRKAQIILVSRL